MKEVTPRTAQSVGSYWVVTLLFVLSMVTSVLVPARVFAAQLGNRSLTLGSSAAGGTTTYTFDFTTQTNDTFQSFQAQFCTTPSGGCTPVTGLDASGASLDSSTLSGTWADDSVAGSLRATATGASATAGGTASQFVFSGVANPSTANQTFYARINLYSDNAYATSVDKGTTAASTSEQIQLTGRMEEALVFCVGTSIGTPGNCGTISGSSIDFGSFSSGATSTGTSVMVASTNSGNGYNITANGSPMTCLSCTGTPTITSMAAAAVSAIGTSQFGFNLVANATPAVGAGVVGSGSGAPNTGYDTADSFQFNTGDTVATASAVTAANTFTVSYIVNVPGDQAAGQYMTAMTYICTSSY